MKKHFLLGVISIMLMLFLVTPSRAITIGFDPGSQTVPIGDQAEVALVISGLGDGAAPSISEFDLDITFDLGLIALSNVVYGDQLDILGFGSLQTTTPFPGGVNLFELSFDSSLDLDDFQADTFTLATLTFDTLAVGTSSLDIFVNTLGDALGDQLTVDNVVSGSISPVPEPATILLLASGMAGLGVFGRKKFRK